MNAYPIACAACSHCNTTTYSFDLMFVEHGQVCSSCYYEEDINTGFTSNYQNTAASMLACFFAQFIFNPLMLMSICAIAGAIAISRLATYANASPDFNHIEFPEWAERSVRPIIAVSVVRVSARLETDAGWCWRLCWWFHS